MFDKKFLKENKNWLTDFGKPLQSDNIYLHHLILHHQPSSTLNSHPSIVDNSIEHLLLIILSKKRIKNVKKHVKFTWETPCGIRENT